MKLGPDIQTRLIGRRRLVACALLVAGQTAFFAAFWPTPPSVVSDNVRYELAGWNLASGRGLVLPESLAPDPDVHSWACRPGRPACVEDSIPTAMYPPGYQVFVAGIYKLFGRDLRAILVAQWLLLILLFLLFEAIAYRTLDIPGYAFAIIVGSAYPFLARQAAWVMSDHLHATLVFVPIAAHRLLGPGPLRGAVFGAGLAAATLTRPYLLPAIPVLMVLPGIWRSIGASRKEYLVAVLSCALLFGLWAGRNAYVFGRFIPLTTAGLGPALLLNKLEWDLDGQPDLKENKDAVWHAFHAEVRDPFSWAGSRDLQREALVWLREHPWETAQMVVGRIPRLWVSLKYGESGLVPGWPLLLVYLGGLLLLGCAGMWRVRLDRQWWVAGVIVLTYWVFLLHTTAEARRTLPLRLPMILFAGQAFSALLASSRRLNRTESKLDLAKS